MGGILQLESPPRRSGQERHFVRFYDQEEVLLEEVAEFLDIPLRAGGVAIVIATAEHIGHLRRILAGFGAGPDQAPWFTGELLAFEANAVLAQILVNEWPDAQRFDAIVGKIIREASAGGRAVHAFGEMVAILCSQGRYEAAIRLEQLWNGLQGNCSFSLFCAYPWNLFTSRDLLKQFQDVCREHDHACPDGTHKTGMEVRELRLLELEQHNRALGEELARAVDATQTLRHREQELADFVNNAAEGLHRVGSDGTILWANKAELVMLGYRWEEYVGRHIAEFHVDQVLIESMLARLGAGETVYDQPAQLRCKDGSVKHVLIHSNGCFVDGKLRYTRCFTRDATDRMLLQQAYRERETLLAEMTSMNQAKDEFLAMLAHELRNPLAPISAAAEALHATAPDPDRVRQTAAIIERQARHLAGLLDDLLDVARVTRGHINMVQEPLILNDALSAAIEQVTPLFTSFSHRLSLEMPGQDAWVRGDYKRLVQVITNILTNAAKYTPAGGSIGVRMAITADMVEIVVSDNGIGMAPELVGRVFELFVQGARSSYQSQGGLGVGLALVKSLVRAHGGTVGAESRGQGKGSKFTVRLPYLPPGVQRATEPLAKVDAAAPSERLRVMIVDDNVDAARMLEMLLDIAGHDVVLAHTGADAIRAAQVLAPDVFLLDIGLPDMDGKELARHLRALPSAARAQLIAVSGYGQARDKESSLSAGFDHHLVKPVNCDELFSLMRKGPP
jgi:PAS domain S-box-containing protein